MTNQHRCRSDDELAELYKILAAYKDSFSALDIISRLLLKSCLPVSTAAAPDKCIDVLITHDMYDDARTVAGIIGVPKDTITIKQANSGLAKSQSLSTWSNEFARRLVWHKIHQLFTQHDCNSDEAVQYFQDQYQKCQTDSHLEKAELLMYQYAILYPNGYNATLSQSVSEKSSLYILSS